MSSSNLAAMLEEVEAFPDATPEQHAALRPYIADVAPDLLGAIFGDQS